MSAMSSGPSRTRKILVCGGRDGGDPELIRMILHSYAEQGPIKVIHGAARGVDRMAGEAARSLGLEVEEYPAEWNSFGKAAGYLRNVRMADEKPDLVLAFPGGRGTQMMVDIALERGIPVRRFDGQGGSATWTSREALPHD